MQSSELEIDSRYGDLVNVREHWLLDQVGPAAGWLSAGRPRREAGRIAFRLALREQLLELAEGALRFGSALHAFAERERATLMPDYTYVVAAQPTTAGHWALSLRRARRSGTCSGSAPTSCSSTPARPEPAASTDRACRSIARGWRRCSGSPVRSPTPAMRCGRPTGSRT